MSQALTQIAKYLRKEDDFLIVAHASPDGDALGSSAAVGYVLKSLGKRFKIYNASGLPERFSWLNLPAKIQSEIPEKVPANIIILDCGDLHRIGEKLEKHLEDENFTLINIDHHLGNPEFGSLNWLDSQKSSVGEMIAILAQELNIPLGGYLGQAVYLAIVSDTGYFSYGNTSPQTMEIAADILKLGLNPGEFNTKIKNQWTLNKLHLHALVLQQTRMYCRDQIAVISVSQELFHQTETSSADCEGLVNTILQLKGVRIAVSLREEDNDFIKFSLRSFGNTDIRLTACRFNGGGHKNAAGGKIKTSLQEAEKLLVADLEGRI